MPANSNDALVGSCSAALVIACGAGGEHPLHEARSRGNVSAAPRFSIFIIDPLSKRSRKRCGCDTVKGQP